MSQWFVRAVVCYGIRRSQNATASGPAIVDVFGMAVVRISVIAVVVGVVVAVNTGSIGEAIVKQAVDTGGVTAFDNVSVAGWKR